MASWSEIRHEAMALRYEAVSGAKRRATFVFGFIALIWFLELVDLALRGSLDALGILPRSAGGLLGIPLAPLLHAGFPHLLGNTLAIIPLGFLVSARRFWHLPFVTVFVTLLTGTLVWMFARPSVHIGSSGVVFGYLGFLMLYGWFERSSSGIVMSLAVGFFYCGALFRVMPGEDGISWESHLFGFLAGAIAARWISARTAAEDRDGVYLDPEMEAAVRVQLEELSAQSIFERRG